MTRRRTEKGEERGRREKKRNTPVTSTVFAALGLAAFFPPYIGSKTQSLTYEGRALARIRKMARVETKHRRRGNETPSLLCFPGMTASERTNRIEEGCMMPRSVLPQEQEKQTSK